jgi:hypothetical protein
MSYFSGDIERSIIRKYKVAYKTSNFKSLDPIVPSCKKKMYNSLEDARDIIRYIKENRAVKDLEAYECTTCGMWHLTSKSK